MGNSGKAVKGVKFYLNIKKYLTILCFFFVGVSIICFFFFGFYSKSSAIRFIAKYKNQQDTKTERIMANPRIKFEHSEGDYYDVKAKRAIHKNGNDILLFDVNVDGLAVNIKAGKLLIDNDGNNLTFSDNPVLIIKETKN
jgi:hypothetical protein